MPPAPPEIIAHRGAWRESFENTLDAFERAVAAGADGIELDVHVTADGGVVVHHDPVVARVADGSPGRGLALWASPLEDVRAIRLPGGHAIPTLDAVLDAMGHRLSLYVEVKAPAGREPAVLACLDRHPGARVSVHAFDHRIAARCRALRPGLPIGFLSASYPLELAAQFTVVRPDAFWQHAALVDAALVVAAHAAGVRLVAWTENAPDRARALAALGVDAICTDDPATLRAALRD